MEFDREIKHETNKTIVICAVILFLIVDLYFIDSIIGVLFGQISNQQQITWGMVAKNQTTASTYVQEGFKNQVVFIVIGSLVLGFLAFISAETIRLLMKVIDKDNKENNREDKKRTYKHDRNPK